MKHGLSAYRNHKCRCGVCREASRLYQAEYRQRVRQRPRRTWPHGTPYGYVTFGCRCGRCTKAWRLYNRRRRAQGKT